MKLPGPLDLIKESINIFFKKENMLYFFKVYFILSVFAAIFFAFDSLTNNYNASLNLASLMKNFTGLSIAILPLAVIIGLLYLIFSFWISAAGIVAVSNVVSGKIDPVKKVFSVTWKRLFMFSVLTFTVGLITTLGFILLIIPGIIFLVWFSFSSFEFLTKGAGIGASLSGSKKLVTGRFFPILGRLLVFSLFGILVEVIIGFIPLGLGTIIQPFFGALLILPPFLLYRELSNG